MARGVSHEELYRWQYRRLKKVEGQLRAKGIQARYSKWEVHVPLADGGEARVGHKLIGPASNGEVALVGNIIIHRGDGTREWYTSLYGTRTRPAGTYDKGLQRIEELAGRAA